MVSSNSFDHTDLSKPKVKSKQNGIEGTISIYDHMHTTQRPCYATFIKPIRKRRARAVAKIIYSRNTVRETCISGCSQDD